MLTLFVFCFVLFCFCCFVFCWHLLICENTVIQVVKLTKKKKEKKEEKIHVLGEEPKSAPRRRKPAFSPLGQERLLLSPDVNFTTYLFFLDKLPINMKMLVFFLAKCVRTAAKTTVWTQKKTKSTSFAIFDVETTAKYCELKRCADRVHN